VNEVNALFASSAGSDAIVLTYQGGPFGVEGDLLMVAAKARICAFTTTEAYVTGGICGSMWWPYGELGGTPFHARLRGPLNEWDRYDCDTFAECLGHLLIEKGGDFSGSQFTADTEVVIVRVAWDTPGHRRIHSRSFHVTKLPGCADLVNADVYTGDMLGDE
jgi:hypothetical protein